MTKASTRLRNINGKNGPRKTTNMCFTYIKSNPSQRGYRKRMKEIWTDSTRFNTSEKLADQKRMILKKGLFSDLEILEICGQINREEYVPDTPAELKH